MNALIRQFDQIKKSGAKSDEVQHRPVASEIEDELLPPPQFGLFKLKDWFRASKAVSEHNYQVQVDFADRATEVVKHRHRNDAELAKHEIDLKQKQDEAAAAERARAAITSQISKGAMEAIRASAKIVGYGNRMIEIIEGEENFDAKLAEFFKDDVRNICIKAATQEKAAAMGLDVQFDR